MSSAQAEATRLLAEALQIEQSEISDDTAIGATERWDSLAHMRLMLALEELLGKQIETDDMLSIERHGDVVTYLENNLS